MRISDWSSDVCSSDLPSGAPNSAARAAQERAIKAEDVVRAALAAHAKQAEPQAVAVKPLRWPPECPRGQRVYGRGITLKYCIAHYGGDSEDQGYRLANEREDREGGVEGKRG